MGAFGAAGSFVAGLADAAAGSTDETVGRTLDSTSGGGVTDPSTYTSVVDDMAGSTDEFTGRTFDSTPGGGATDPKAWYDAVARAGDRGVGYFDEGFDNIVDYGFQRPGELPHVSSEDNRDLPFGSPSNPLGDPNFQGEDRSGLTKGPYAELKTAAVLIAAGYVAVNTLPALAAGKELAGGGD